MENIVTKGLCVDFHIHSSYSKHLDGDKVSNNTIENVELLFNNLTKEAYKVNSCAITDHDVFSYDMYKKLKSFEGNKSLKKVFPGVEFSVCFKNDKTEKVIHVIALFNDENEEKVIKLEELLKLVDGKPRYDYLEKAYTEKKFLDILRKADMDTILIAHQKKSLLSQQSPAEHDVNSLGDVTVNEFLFSGYFEAFEFRNKKNEVFNNIFRNTSKYKDNLKFITGSDCHDWEVYPKVNSDTTIEFNHSYLKCLPTFRGIVMAFTEFQRIRYVDSFFNTNDSNKEKLEITIDKKRYDIPLSKGINVFIGDNSIGKSLFLHKLTSYIKNETTPTKILSNNLKGKYEKYIQKHNIQISSSSIIEKKDIFVFDSQNEIRKNFEEGLLKSKDFLSKRYPKDIDVRSHKTIIQNEFSKLYKLLKNKFDYDSIKQSLVTQKINLSLEEPINISFSLINIDNSINISNLESIIAQFKQIKDDINALLILDQFAEEDKKYFFDSIIKIEKYKTKYKNKLQKTKLMDIEINKINGCISLIDEGILGVKSDNDKNVSDDNLFFLNLSTTIEKTYLASLKISKYKANDSVNLKIIPKDYKYNKYQFITKTVIEDINEIYFQEVLKRVLNKDCKIDTSKITKDKLVQIITRYEEGIINPIDCLKMKINTVIDSDLKNINIINIGGMEKTKELSDGLNSTIYFDLISYEKNQKGIYIIDQPEDNVSQTSIKNQLIERFQTMSNNRQVLMVTHNPQFVVNLDVDNVIFLSKDIDNNVIIKSGALEYIDKTNDCDILKIVADNLEGGIETINRRWRRYEKINLFER